MDFDDCTEEIKIAFAALDKDGDSELSKEEIAVLIENLSGQSPSADQIARVFAWFGINIGGKIPLNRLIVKINEWISGTSSRSRANSGGGRTPDSPRRVRKRGAVQRSIKKFFVDLLRNTTSCMERLKNHPEQVLRRLEMLGNDVATTLGCINNYHSLQDEQFTSKQKLEYASRCIALMEKSNGMRNILKPLMSENDPARLLKSLEELKFLMELKRVFRSPEERYEINDVIFQIFNSVYQSRVMDKIKTFLRAEWMGLIQDLSPKDVQIKLRTQILVCSIIGDYVGGPNFSHMREQDFFHPRNKKCALQVLGNLEDVYVLESIFRIIQKSRDYTVKAAACRVVGSLGELGSDISNFVMNATVAYYAKLNISTDDVVSQLALLLTGLNELRTKYSQVIIPQIEQVKRRVIDISNIRIPAIPSNYIRFFRTCSIVLVFITSLKSRRQHYSNHDRTQAHKHGHCHNSAAVSPHHHNIFESFFLELCARETRPCFNSASLCYNNSTCIVPRLGSRILTP